MHGGGVMALQLTSPAFSKGEKIPQKFTCDGDDVLPSLKWTGSPENTKSFVFIMDDPDAPPGTWVHWVLYNLPANVSELKEGFAKRESFADGTRQGLCWGVTEDQFNRVGYYGPCPPQGPDHRYYFKLYALDTILEVPAKANKFQIEKAMQGHILAQAQIMGQYGRSVK